MSANENFLHIIGYRAEELKQHSHQLLVDSDYAKSAEYVQLWQDMRAEKPQIGKVKRLSKEGKPVWLHASYTSVMDRHTK